MKNLFHMVGMGAVVLFLFSGCVKKEGAGETGEVVGHLDLNYAYGVAVSGDYVYVACKTNGVYVVDISDVSSPAESENLAPSGIDARRVFVDGSRLYVAGFDAGLFIYDISNPANPSLLGTYTEDTLNVNNVYASGDKAYVVGGYSQDGGIVVLNVSDPSNPTVEARYRNENPEETNRGYQSIWVDGNYVYAGTNGGYLHILELPDLTLKGTYYNPGTPGHEPWLWDITVAEGKAYLADWGAGLIVVDVSNPEQPTQLGVFTEATDGPNFYGVVLDGNTLYTANGWGGVVVLDVSDPANMKMTLEVNPENASYLDIALSGNYVLVPNNGSPQGLDIIKIK